MSLGFSVFGIPVVCEVSPSPPSIAGHLSENDLRPTRDEDLIPLLKELGIDQVEFRACVQRFREWFGVAIVRVILRDTTSAFLATEACCRLFQESNAPLFPLNVPLTAEQERTQIEWIRSKRRTLEEQLSTNPNENREERLKYRTALCSLESMLWLMSGSWIPGLLPDGCPTGYICARLAQLQRGRVLSEFAGLQSFSETVQEMQERYPSDTTILTFLMCIYLKAPGMDLSLFHQEAPKVRNGPLVFMNVAPFTDPAYSAILTFVPMMREHGSHAFIVRHRLWGGHIHEAISTVMVNGTLRVNFGGRNGFFEGMTLYLLYHKCKFGNIGGISFDLMHDIDWVFGEKATPSFP